MTVGPLDQSFRRALEAVPARVRRDVSKVPRSLGFPNGSWHDYAHLAPVIDLPGLAWGGEGLARARFAHHCGGFWGLTRDRTIDGQVREPIARDAERALRAVWFEACAASDAPLAAARGEGAWKTERHARRRRARTVDEYVRTSWWKVSWFAVATTAWLERHRPRAVVTRFVQGVVAMMLGLQLGDDAADDHEDRARFGKSVSDQLGCSRWSLARASGRLFAEAARHFRVGGFPALAGWNLERARAVRADVGA